jgi:glycosyltransferase involved in cell wall biosynthesis
MKITFILPGPGDVPIGGFKVVYAYANELVKRGHEVNVVNSWVELKRKNALFFLNALVFAIRRQLGWYGGRGWCEVDTRVNNLLTNALFPEYIPDADVVVATAWDTAVWVNRYPAIKGRKFYLIQHLETWAGQEKAVLETWQLPLQKIVIVRWLEKVATDLGQPSCYVPNGLDFQAFNLDFPIESRHANSLLFLYHPSNWKGSADAIAALEVVRQQTPIQVQAFSAWKKPKDFPDWIVFHHRPTQSNLRALYNQAAIFIAPSWSEGWGLPPAEAMMCGAAVVGTQIGGHAEFMKHQVNALLSAPKDVTQLAANIATLLDNTALRLQLATAGNTSIQQFTWTRATDSLLRVLER